MLSLITLSMPANHISCGPPANLSEIKAVERLKPLLDKQWTLLSNLQVIADEDRQPSEIDIIAVGPAGVLVIEVKHWDPSWVRKNNEKAEDGARILKSKTERVGGMLRRRLQNFEIHAKQVFLFTKESNGNQLPSLGGAPVWTLKSADREVKKINQNYLTEIQISLIVKALEPRARFQMDGRLRSVGEFQNMELFSPEGDRFHRIYRAQHRRTHDKVILHLYDLSASQEADPFGLAERECLVLQELQKCRFVPRTRDSFQELPGFPGEVYMFSIFDPGAPSLRRRVGDQGWSVEDRLLFAASVAEALAEVHGVKEKNDTQVVHRNLSPDTILVGANNRPVFSGFDMARLTCTKTLIVKTAPVEPADSWIAPELTGGDLSKASTQSDIYAICGSLLSALSASPDAVSILQKGLVQEPSRRISLDQLKQELERLSRAKENGLAEPSLVEAPSLLKAEFWCEGTEIVIKRLKLEVIACLGSGAIGRTFKVAEVNPETGEYYGTYVAKVINDEHAGNEALKGYRRVRPYADRPGLATVYEIAERWQPDTVAVLLKWIEREPLSGLKDGLIGLAIQESGAETLRGLVKKWLHDGCEALALLHANGLVHGDISPGNLIYCPDTITLIDYDSVVQSGSAGWTSGTRPYCSPEAEKGEALNGSDDIYALAASIYAVVFEEEKPFCQPSGANDKSGGLSWHGDSRELLGPLTEFFEIATQPNRQMRFRDAIEAREWLQSNDATATDIQPGDAENTLSSVPLADRSPQVVTWLDSLLSVYPGSPRGNVETRGLDSEFAAATYVPTALEEELVHDLRNRRLKLLILCGNAGDGKTALLQRIASEFGGGNVPSEQRVWTCVTRDGLTLKANLDGSAAWNQWSADELLDDILLPFIDGAPEDQAHLLAINDGRLLQWLDEKQAGGLNGELVDSLSAFLSHEDDAELPTHLRFISLNHRSLVGGKTGAGEANDQFVEKLIYALVGGEHAAEIWEPCLNCSAWDRCSAGPMAHRLIRPDDPGGALIRRRLLEIFQAVHQRGNVHITARELRGVISYVLFGVHSCQELHDQPDLRLRNAESLERIGDMAFNPDSPYRQGDLLKEMTKLDPALEAHCELDRYLVLHASAVPDFRSLSGGFPADPVNSRAFLAALRRTAYFQWTPDEFSRNKMQESALGLAGGEYLLEFQHASSGTAEENAGLCQRVVRGISHLEDLPVQVLQRRGQVPLRLPSRTPTETKFWVELDSLEFQLEPDLPKNLDAAVPRLARQLRLIHTNGRGGKETLLLGYQLFATLLRLEAGEQLADVSSDDLFANLQIFTQRIAQGGSRSLFAWNPKEDELIYRLALSDRGEYQSLVIDSKFVTPIS